MEFLTVEQGALPALLDDLTVPSSTWGTEGTTKPRERLEAMHRDGEARFYLHDGRLGYESQKVSSCIFSPDRTQMLFELRRFASGAELSSPANKSASEKLRFLSGEAYLAGFKRMCKEEFQIILADDDLSTLYFLDTKISEHVESRSFPGLLAHTTKHRVLWLMPKHHVRQKYVEDCGYRMSWFYWGQISKAVQKHLKMLDSLPKAA